MLADQAVPERYLQLLAYSASQPFSLIKAFLVFASMMHRYSDNGVGLLLRGKTGQPFGYQSPAGGQVVIVFQVMDQEPCQP